jgi:hypothetical protein
MRPQMKLWAGLLIICFASIAFGADIYVSPTGNDAAAGTSTAPLATLAAARDKADQLKAGNTPVTVYLHGGTYYLSAPVVFGPANSGTATAPIVYTAFSGEKPVVSGGIKVTSAWTASSNANIMVTTLATNLKVDQLFLNGTRQVLARYPNFDANTVILNGYAADCISATRIARWANPTEGPGYIRGLHINLWGSTSYIITGKSGTTITQQWVGDNGRGSGMHATYRMVENLFEELDAAGEWFYRKSTGQLFFWPPAGTNLSTATIELASQDELLRFVGTSAASAGSVKYIQFNGITFTHTFRTLFSKPYEFVLQSDWAITRAGAVFMQNAENIRIANCLFDQIGGNGVFLSGYNRNHVIYNNTFSQGGASCVAIVGMQSAVRCAATAYGQAPACTDKVPGPKTNEYPAYIKVDNNMMANSGRFEKQTSGVTMSMTEFDTVRHNTVHDCPRAGINFTDGCWGGTLVEYNWVYNSVLESEDHGPFNAWGRDRIELNMQDSSWARLDSRNPTIVRNNRFEVMSGKFGIDLDDRASNYTQYNNLLIGGGLKLATTRWNVYTNNILVGGANLHFDGSLTNSMNYGRRNIFVGANNQIYRLCCHVGANWYNCATVLSDVPSKLKSRNVTFDSNCVCPTSGQPVVSDESGTLTWAQWQSSGNGLDVHSTVATDPMFTDANKTWPNYQPRGDYSVRQGSPALALGFKNFPMDSFGVMQVPSPVQGRHVQDVDQGAGRSVMAVRYNAGRLTVSNLDEYTVTVSNAAGRTVKVFKGKGNSCFKINAKASGSGVYFVAVRTRNGMTSQKFLME